MNAFDRLRPLAVVPIVLLAACDRVTDAVAPQADVAAEPRLAREMVAASATVTGHAATSSRAMRHPSAADGGDARPGARTGTSGDIVYRLDKHRSGYNVVAY